MVCLFVCGLRGKKKGEIGDKVLKWKRGRLLLPN